MNDVQHRAPAQSAARVCARAHLAHANEHSIIHHPAGCRRMPHRMLAQRAYAHLRCARMRARRHAILPECCARRWNVILELASPVLGSGVGKIVQADDPGIVKPGALGGAGRGALILPGVAGRWALVSAPSAPANPGEEEGPGLPMRRGCRPDG